MKPGAFFTGVAAEPRLMKRRRKERGKKERTYGYEVEK